MMNHILLEVLEIRVESARRAHEAMGPIVSGGESWEPEYP